MATYTVEQIDTRTTAIVLKRQGDFVTLLRVDMPAGTQVEVTPEPDPQYAEYDVYRVLCAGWSRFQRIGTDLYVRREPGELAWQTLDRLGIDEENLLP